MNKVGLSALTSHWRRRPGQFAALLLGLMLATALWSAVQAINAEARRAYEQATDLLASSSVARLVQPDGGAIPLAEYVALRRAGHLVSPVIESRYQGVVLLGVDPLTAPPGTIPAPILSDVADFPNFTGAASGPVIFANPNVENITGVTLRPSAALPPGTALADITVVAELTGQSDPSYLLVAPDQPQGLPPLETALEWRSPGAATDPGELTTSFHLNLTAFGLLAFGVGLFIAHGAIGLAVEQRRPVIRTLRALGMPLRRIILLLGAELLGFSLLAGVLGLGLGYLIAASLLPGVAGTLRGLYGAPVPGELGFDPAWAFWALAITVLGAAVAGAGALWQVARMPVLQPALPRAWAMGHGRRLRWQGVAALALALAGALLAGFGSGLVVAFTALGSVLIAAALALPLALWACLQSLTPLARGPLARWLLADTRQQVPGLSLALMALLLALAANIGVSTMVGSFRDTFVTWIEQRLGAEVYVFAGENPDALLAFLAPRTDAILPIAQVDRPVLGDPGRVRVLADHATLTEGWPLLSQNPGAWAAFHDGEAAFINEQLALRHDLKLGQMLPITPDLSLPVAAIYADYGNPLVEVALGEPRFAATFPGVAPAGYALRLDPGQIPDLMAQMQAFGVPAGDMTDQITQRALSIEIFDRTFQVTGALSALTLGVAGLALLIAFLTLAQMRLGQLAPVWALGLTARQLARTEMARALALAFLTTLLAIPVGVALAWMLLNLVNTEAFGWRLPLSLYPADWLRLLALALVAAGAAALWPAIRLAQMPPARLLQVFAHER